MASSKSGPASIDEGISGIVQAISAALTAPDAAGPQGQALMQLLQATLGIKKMGAGGAQKPAGGPAGAGMGGGTNINQLMGGGAQPPSAGAATGPSQSGMSADDMQRAVASQAGAGS